MNIRASLALYADETEAGWYKTEDGASYDNAEDLIQNGILGFCCCGNPKMNLEYIKGALEILAEWFPSDKSKPTISGADHMAKLEAYFQSDAASGFFWYWADKEKLVEHGGSLPGWPSERGYALLNLLREWAAL